MVMQRVVSFESNHPIQ